ncbi:MAG: OmpH family outer membrane protein [Flavobacteriaceae bacterium]|nr:OmpH family outer membrane protein [Flavobacteriaceae bacterium]
MKKLNIFLVIVIIFSIQLNAQSKVGTVDVEYIISAMTELEQVRTDLTSYNKDLESQSKLKINTFQTLVDSYQQNESTYSEAIKKEKQSEIIALENDIKQFQQNSNKLIQLKQDELIQPLYKIIGDALNAVSKEEKFTQVFTINNNIVYLDPKMDLTIKVMKKMRLPIPKE